MTVVILGLRLVAGDTNLLGVDDDDVVAGVDVRRVFRLVLAAQAASDFGGQAAERLVSRIDDIPVACDGLRLSTERLHG